MNGYQAYRYYQALKLHFTKDNFDVFVNPKVKCSYQKYEGRNDYYLFEKLARKYPTDADLIQYFVSNFAYGHKEVVYEDEESKEFFLQWNRRKESISKVLDDDLGKIILYAEKNKLKKSDVLDIPNDGLPLLLSMYIGQHIAIESLRIIDDYIPMIDNWRKIPTLFLWEDELRKIIKLKRFVKYDKIRVDKIMNNFINDLTDL